MSIRAINFYFDNAKALNLTPQQQVVLLILADQARDEGDSWPSVNTITRKTAMTAATIKRTISELGQMGYIVRLKRARPNGSSRSSITLLSAYRTAYKIRDDYSEAEAAALASLKPAKKKKGGASGDDQAPGEGSAETPQEGTPHDTPPGQFQPGGVSPVDPGGVSPMRPLDPLVLEPITYTSYMGDDAPVQASAMPDGDETAPALLNLDDMKTRPAKKGGKVQKQLAAIAVAEQTKPSDHPAVKHYRHRFGKFPNKVQMQIIAETDMKLEHWKRAVDNWAARGYNPQSIDKMLRLATSNKGEYENTFDAPANTGNGRVVEAYTPQPVTSDEDRSWMFDMMESGSATFMGGVGYNDVDLSKK